MRHQLIHDHPQHLFRQSRRDIGVETGIDDLVLGHFIEFFEQQHVGEEGTHAIFQPGGANHALRNGGQLGGVRQLPLFGGLQQRFVGRRIPQQEAKPGRAGEIVEPHVRRAVGIGFRAFHDIEEMGRHQHGGQRQFQPLVEGGAGLRRLTRHHNIGSDFLLRHGAAEQGAADRQQHARGTIRVRHGGVAGGAGHELGAVVGVEYLRCDGASHGVELLKARWRNGGGRSARGDQFMHRTDDRFEPARHANVGTEYIGDAVAILRFGQAAHRHDLTQRFLQRSEGGFGSGRAVRRFFRRAGGQAQRQRGDDGECADHCCATFVAGGVSLTKAGIALASIALDMRRHWPVAGSRSPSASFLSAAYMAAQS